MSKVNPLKSIKCQFLLSSLEKLESLGGEYSEAHILDLELTWEESEPRTPLVCILSVGSDPTNQIIALAKLKNIRKTDDGIRFRLQCLILFPFPFSAIKAVSMGQGQEYHARKMMTECMAAGEVVVDFIMQTSSSLKTCSYFCKFLRWLGSPPERSSLVELLR